MWWFSVICIVGLRLVGLQALTMREMKDYCMRDKFSATCKNDEVVMVTGARYGRMRTGKCISEQYGQIGCSSDVTTYLDGLCSGRHTCSTDVRLLIDVTSPCPKDFMAYLQAGFQCRKVATGNREECHRRNYVTLEASSGHLASVITEETAYGSAGCPWKLQAQPGQKINLTLYDFNRPWSFNMQEDYVRDEGGNMGCPVSLVVEDGQEKKSLRLCETGDRVRHLYMSESNEILVHFSLRNKGNKHHYYMVQYQAVACPDLQVPSSAWMRRDGDNARVQCNTSGEVWYLTCREGRWIGDLGNCSTSIMDSGPPRAAFPIGLLLAVVIGVVLGVVIGACLLGVVFLCRKGIKMREREEGSSILHSRRAPPAVTEILYTETDGGPRLITGTRPLRDPRDPRSPRGSDYGCKRPIEGSTRNSLMDETRKVIPDFVQAVDEAARTNPCLRSHVYESPKFQVGTIGTLSSRPGGGPPVYHELDTDNEHERCPRHIIDH